MNTYERYAPFIREYIFGSKYKEKIIGYDNEDDDWSAFLSDSSIS